MDWESLEADLSAITGWPPSEVGEITLPRLDKLQQAWKRHPPKQLLIEAYVGWKADPEEEAPPPIKEEDAKRMDDWLERRINDLAQGKG